MKRDKERKEKFDLCSKNNLKNFSSHDKSIKYYILNLIFFSSESPRIDDETKVAAGQDNTAYSL